MPGKSKMSFKSRACEIALIIFHPMKSSLADLDATSLFQLLLTPPSSRKPSPSSPSATPRSYSAPAHPAPGQGRCPPVVSHRAQESLSSYPCFCSRDLCLASSMSWQRGQTVTMTSAPAFLASAEDRKGDVIRSLLPGHEDGPAAAEGLEPEIDGFRLQSLDQLFQDGGKLRTVDARWAASAGSRNRAQPSAPFRGTTILSSFSARASRMTSSACRITGSAVLLLQDSIHLFSGFEILQIQRRPSEGCYSRWSRRS